MHVKRTDADKVRRHIQLAAAAAAFFLTFLSTDFCSVHCVTVVITFVRYSGCKRCFKELTRKLESTPRVKTPAKLSNDQPNKSDGINVHLY